jgi:hypothetical protein
MNNKNYLVLRQVSGGKPTVKFTGSEEVYC